MKRALVLSGGGSKGAYEVGCIRALKEMEIKFDIVCGTSIGALNGLLVVQQDYEALETLWKNMKAERVMKDPIYLSADTFINHSNLLVPFFKSYLSEKGADITPLKETVFKLFDEKKYRESPIDYGTVTVKFPSLEALEITKKNMDSKDAVHYALASASCFPAFPIYKIGETGYIDGGYYDNLPISLAIEMGAKEIIAIELNCEATHSHYVDRPNIKIIYPSKDLGGFLDFDRSVLDFRITLGYNDTMKYFQKYKGYIYTFYRTKMRNSYLFYEYVLKYESDMNRLFRTKLLKKETPMTTFLLGLTHKKVLTIDDYYLLALETTLTHFRYPVETVYDSEDISAKVYNDFKIQYHKSDGKIDENKSRFSQITNSISHFSLNNRVNIFYEAIMNDDYLNTTFKNYAFIREFIVASFLYFYEQHH